MSAIPSCSVHHVKMFVDAFSTSCRLQRHIPPATDENVGQFVLVNGKCSSIIFSPSFHSSYVLFDMINYRIGWINEFKPFVMQCV